MVTMAEHMKKKQEFLAAAEAEAAQKVKSTEEERPICDDCGEYESDCVCDWCELCGCVDGECTCEKDNASAEEGGCSCGDDECTQKTSDTPKPKTSPNVPYGLKEQTAKAYPQYRQITYPVDPKLSDPYYDVKAKILTMSSSQLRGFLNEASIATKSKTLQNIVALLETELFTSADVEDFAKDIAAKSLARLVAGLWTNIVTNRI